MDPQITLRNDKTSTIDILKLQTNITKCLGPIDEWDKRLAVAYKTGYNAIHFTPMQVILKIKIQIFNH